MGLIEQHWTIIAAVMAVVAIFGGAFFKMGMVVKNSQVRIPCIEEECLKMPHVVRHMEFFGQIMLQQTKLETILSQERKITFEADERFKELLTGLTTNLFNLTNKLDAFINTYERDRIKYYGEGKRQQ